MTSPPGLRRRCLHRHRQPCASAWEKLVWKSLQRNWECGTAGFETLQRLRRPRASSLTPQSGVHLPCLTTDILLADPRWRSWCGTNARSYRRRARARFDVAEAFADQQIERTRTMGAYKASTLIDFERGQPLELQSLFLEPLRQATQAAWACRDSRHCARPWKVAWPRRLDYRAQIV